MSDEPDRDHDAVLRAMDFDSLGSSDRGPNGYGVVWAWRGDRRTMSPNADELMRDLKAEASERYDLESFDHDTIVARVWVDDNDELTEVIWDAE